MTTEEKIAHLRSKGWTVGPRDPRLNTDFPGSMMVVEEHGEDELPTKDGSNGPWCLVGDDLEAMVEEAYRFQVDMFENEENAA